MSAALPPEAVALAVCTLLTAAALSIAAASHDRSMRRARTRSPRTLLRGIGSRRAVAAAAAGVLVLLATKWLFMSLMAAALVGCWGMLVHDRHADDERRRVEGIAKWLEDLRDTLRGSAMGPEEALEQVATHPPDSLSLPLTTYVRRRRQGFPTEDALADLADDLAHPTSDAAVAAIRLVIGGSTSAGRLHATAHSLSLAARAEVAARQRIDRTRTVYRSSMKRLIVIGTVLVMYLKATGGDLLQPYNEASGQVFLLVPLSMWAGSLVWLRSLCRYEDPRRYRIVGTTEVGR